MLYPQNASMAIGSRRTTPTLPVIAAVVSEPSVAAIYTPSSQVGASTMSGTVEDRRPPNTNAAIGTPCGSSQFASIDGHCDADTVKRALGCAASRPVFLLSSGVHSLPCQSVSRVGGWSVMPSHQTSPSGVSATLVKMTFALSIRIALGLVASDVPGATPKKPYSGLIA